MSLSRSLSRFLSSSNSQKWSLFRSSSFSTKTLAKPPINRAYRRNPKPSSSEFPKPPINPANKSNPAPSASEFPKPSEIPFQAKVANSVHLVGSIGVPVQLQNLPSGLYAVTILVQESTKKDSPQLCIPVIFQRDLAQIAAFHLKESDLVYVTGQLTGDALPRTVEDRSQETVEGAQSRIQVLANSLSFVQKTCPEKESEMMFDQDIIASDSLAEVEEGPSDLHLWNDLLAHPRNWWDNRSSKNNPERAAFKHKKSSQQLWINDSTPEWVLSKLDTLSCGPTSSDGTNEPNNGADSLWRDLVNNPQQWWDNRGDKLRGSVSPKYPDFKQKNTNKVLWLDTAPGWLVQRIDSLVFCGGNSTTKNEKENLWRDLVKNPSKWTDNRSSKLKPNHPDFKHKDTGEALWLGSSTPSWVLPKLPPPVAAKKELVRAA